jgi:hypothetical protein
MAVTVAAVTREAFCQSVLLSMHNNKMRYRDGEARGDAFRFFVQPSFKAQQPTAARQV